MNRLRAVAKVQRCDEGRRLVLRAGRTTFDYFPQTAEWVRRGSNRRRRGLRELIREIIQRAKLQAQKFKPETLIPASRSGDFLRPAQPSMEAR